MTTTFSKSNLLFLVIFSVFVVAVFSYNQFQAHISYESEPLLDAHQYLKAYLYFRGDLTEFNVTYPFNTRIGIPFLAAQLPFEEAITNFKIIHFISISLSIVFFHLSWKKLELPILHQLIFWFWLLFHWLGPVRYVIHEPIMVDTAVYLFSSLFLWAFTSQKHLHFWWIVPLSVVFKESLLPYVFVLAISSVIIEKSNTKAWRYFLVFLSGFILLYLIKWLFPMAIYNWKYQAPITVVWYLKNLALSPLNNLRWIAALILSVGLLPVLFNYQKNHLKQPELYLFLTAVFLGFSSGLNYSRILYLGFPFMALFILNNLKDKKLLIYCFLLSIPFLHLFSETPNITDNNYNNWHAEFADWKTITQLFTYVLGCYLAWKVIKKLEITLPKWLHKKL